MPEPGVIIAGVSLLACAVLGWLLTRAARRVAELQQVAAELERQLVLVRQSIGGLTAGAVGLDRRVQGLESRARSLSERQDTFELQQTDEQPYGHAIRLVQQGAGISRLVDELGLSESEADLIVRLHGHRDSA
jgi:hypothetical protein